MIGIDIGTTSTKAVAITERGEVLASHSMAYTAITDGDGRHELDPEMLLGAVVSVLKAVFAEVEGMSAGDGRLGSSGVEGMMEGRRFGAPAGVSFSCAMHSLIAVDAQGALLTRAITWADLRSKPYAESIKGTAAGARIYRHTGTPVHAMSPLFKLMWLRDKEPGIFGRAAKFISIKEYIWWRFCGQYQVDVSIASATGLFDLYARDWYAESLELAGIGAERLSRPVPCTHTEIGSSIDPALPDRLVLVIGGSDGCLANLGSGAVRPGETALTIGTSGAIRMTAGAPAYDPRERIFNYILAHPFYVSGGATNNGGGVLQWYISRFLGKGVASPATGMAGPMAGMTGSTGKVTNTAASPEEINELLEKAATAPAGSDGLVFLPYLQGERAPVWDAEAKGVFFGVRSSHEQAHFVRALLEGICFSLYQVGASLEETIGPIGHIYASGGFTRSPFWLQMVADVFMKKVHTTNGADASAMGAAIMGFHATGVLPDLADVGELVRIRDSYEPDALRHDIYLKNFSVYVELYVRLKDLM